jgi:periplasmic protein CpxP/Spy
MNTEHFQAPGRALRLLTATAMIALAGAVLQTAHAAPGGMGGMGGHSEMGAMGGRGMGMHGPGHMGHMGHMGRMLDQAGASAEQKAQIKTIMEAARTDLKPVHAQMKTLRSQSAGLFTQPNVDANAVEASRQQMHALHGQVSKRMAQAMVESSRVLTPEQRAKMADMMNKRRAMAERHRAEAESLMGKPPGVK